MASYNTDSLLDTLKKKLLTFKLTVDALNEDLTKKTTQLDAEHKKLSKAGDEVAAIQHRIRLLEDDLETTDSKLAASTVKLDTVSKQVDESERFRRMLQSRQTSDDDRIEQLSAKIKQSTTEAAVATEKLNEATKKLSEAEDSLFQAEKRVEDADARIRSMEDELGAVTTSLKSMELNESAASKTKQAHTAALEKLVRELADAERRASSAESDIQSKMADFCKFEEELDSEKLKNESLRREMENIVADLQNI